MEIKIPDFIEVYPKAFSDEWCSDVIAEFDAAEAAGFTRGRQEAEPNSTAEIKDDAIMFMNDFNFNHTSRKIGIYFTNIFWGELYPDYAKKYNALSRADEHKIYMAKVQKTLPGQGYHAWHFENAARSVANRLLAYVVYLNDVDEGGETEFLYQRRRTRPEAGTCVIFPAGFTHLHRGNPPLSGEKYILTGWVEF